MKLEVGMYVRTKDGVIGKITNKDYTYSKSWIIDTLYYNFDESVDKWTCGVKEYEISKASHNIKELLKVGDFVDYEYPTGLGMWYCKNVEITEHLLNVFKNGENNHEYKITSIVTKERFEQIQYKVEE